MDEVKFKIVEWHHHYTDDYYGDDIHRVFCNLEWETCTEQEFSELVHGISLLNTRRNINKGRLAIVRMPSEPQTELIELSRKAVLESITKQKKEAEKRKKEAEARQREKEAKAMEKKRKQLEKLKKELGDE